MTLPQPLGLRVLARLDPEEKVTRGGLHLPESAVRSAREETVEPETANIVAVGPGEYLDSGDFVATRRKVGERVIFQRGHCVLLHVAGYDDVDFCIIDERAILAVAPPSQEPPSN